jgi:hypothetical protein
MLSHLRRAGLLGLQVYETGQGAERVAGRTGEGLARLPKQYEVAVMAYMLADPALNSPATARTCASGLYQRPLA